LLNSSSEGFGEFRVAFFSKLEDQKRMGMEDIGKAWLITLLMLVSASFYALKIPMVKADGTIYIRADGSIDPQTANIARDTFNVTYTFTGNNPTPLL